MLCEKCGVNNATTHIHSMVNGNVYEKHLCDMCAMEEKYANIKGNSLTKMLSDIFGDTVVSANENKVTRCSCCGSTFADIADSGNCGCAECYSVFYEKLLPYFKRVHGSTKHIGKKPYSIYPKNEVNEIDNLRALLLQYIKEENYEQAAVIRDKIKEIKGDI